jgi:hypothetical protein
MEFEKMGKQRARIEELLKQLLDEVASNRSSLARVKESMRELKSATEGSAKRIKAVEKMEASPPPSRHHRRARSLRHREGHQPGNPHQQLRRRWT